MKRITSIIFAFLLALTALAGSARATSWDYYFGSMGTDSGAGTASSPFSLHALNINLANGTLTGKHVACLNVYPSSELELTEKLVVSGSPGVVIGCVQDGSRWAARMSKIFAKTDWTLVSGQTHIFQADGEYASDIGTATIPSVMVTSGSSTFVLPLTKLLGNHFSDVSASMASTAGTCWTGPTSIGDPTIRTYVHAPSDADPTTGAVVLERSRLWGSTGATAQAVTIYSGTVQDMELLGNGFYGGPNDNSSTTTAGTPIVLTPAATATGSVCLRSFDQTGGKHCGSIIEGDPNGLAIFDQVQCEQCSPYDTGVGDVVPWVVFATNNTHINAIIRGCKTVSSVALVGATTGTIPAGQLTAISHGTGGAFDSIVYDGCNFSKQLMQLSCIAANRMVVRNSTFGGGTGDNCLVDNCVIDLTTVTGDINGTGDVIVRNSLFRPTQIAATNDTLTNGALKIDQCTVDFTTAPGVGGFLFSVYAASQISVTNSIFILRDNIDFGGFIFQSANGTRDTVAFRNCLVQHSGSTSNQNLMGLSLTNYSVNGNVIYTQLVTDGIFDSSSQNVSSANLDSNYRPIAPTVIRSTNGGDVGCFQYGGVNWPQPSDVSSSVNYGSPGREFVGTKINQVVTHVVNN